MVIGGGTVVVTPAARPSLAKFARVAEVVLVQIHVALCCPALATTFRRPCIKVTCRRITAKPEETNDITKFNTNLKNI